ncbi:uncharacterized protein KY384_006169 [Bacidia gigantensis]|uniref:uncharacterized protein n=1 Tax=Bacidia gigantensis TaxID=2732470 RepID=UPI001D051AF4|nr:uncharacterized protein KY384_006169 [Bacidia gigantensis]KAG8529532.1 hypothetical protein KY384_006169 [Bacidia gigantensis]
MMQRDTRPDRINLPSGSPQLIRTQSRSSDGGRTPSASLHTLPAPPSLSPDPAYIAPSAAAHVVSSGLANRGQSIGDEEDFNEETAATVTASALALINSFLDQLLFSFLATSRSTSILSLRPAISEILKPRLAKEAIDGADEELKGYLAGGDDEELLDFHNGQELKGASNLLHVFKRTRLRCMVYTRLGDMEEEDEEAHLENESPSDDGQNRLSRDLGNVSPAAAIFLTSIIEFVGEQALAIAGDNALSRFNSKKSNTGERILVEDRDVEKIAFNKAIGRLWRAWKKAGRLSIISPRTSSYDQRVSRRTTSSATSRTTSISEHSEANYFGPNRSSIVESSEGDTIAGSKAPPKATDLPAEPDFTTDDDKPPVNESTRGRPYSMIEYPSQNGEEDKAAANQKRTDEVTPSSAKPARGHQRAVSLPTARTTPYSSPVDEAFTTPTERPDPMTSDSQELAKTERELPKLTDDSQKVSDSVRGNQGVSTMYDGLLKRNEKPIPIDPTLASRVSVSEYSESSSIGHDAEMTPQALSFKRAQPNSILDISSEQKSRASTMSSGYSFHHGVQSPLTATDGTNGKSVDGDSESGIFPLRGASLDQPRTEHNDFEKLTALQGEQLKTYDDGGKAVKRDIPVRYEAPSNEDFHNLETAKSMPVDEETTSPTITNRRDIAEASFAQYGDPQAFEAIQHQQAAASVAAAAKNLDTRRPPTSAPAGTERAAVQRVLPSSGSASNSPTTGGRISSSSNREVRPITASSTSSKIKGIIGRESGDAVRHAVPRTTSSEATREITSSSSRSAKSNDKEQDFEQLIQSDETIQYTLTPQNMREMEQPDSPRWSTKTPRVGTISPEATQSVTSTEARSSKSLRGLNGLRSNPTAGSDVMEFASPPDVSPVSTKSNPQRQAKAAGPGTKPIVARDPVTRGDSSKDLADFMRSTGPENENKVPTKSPAGRPDLHSRGASNSSQQSGRPLSRKITKQQPGQVPKKPEVGPVRKSSKLRARDPIASPTNTTAELADFFRSGPPGAQVAQRSVPSPNTNNRMRDNPGSASTLDSIAQSKITQSSTNSRTGLLDSTNKAAGKPSNQRPLNDDMGPVRKQRRVKDPYAIDTDDEEEEEIIVIDDTPQESLSDFLRNYSPPSTSGTDQRNATANASTALPAQDSNNKQRKVSGTSMRERIARNIAVIPDYRPLPPKASKKPPSRSPPQSNEKPKPQPQPPSTSTPPKNRAASTPTATAAQPTVPQLPPLKSMSSSTNTTNHHARPSSPHLTQNGTKFDTYRPSQPTYAKHMDPGNRKPKPLMVARAAEGGADKASGMADLADFLRETEPPAPSGPVAVARPISPVARPSQEGVGGIGGGGRSKVMSYLDR